MIRIAINGAFPWLFVTQINRTGEPSNYRELSDHHVLSYKISNVLYLLTHKNYYWHIICFGFFCWFFLQFFANAQGIVGYREIDKQEMIS